jgi:hypothetical protein
VLSGNLDAAIVTLPLKHPDLRIEGVRQACGLPAEGSSARRESGNTCIGPARETRSPLSPTPLSWRPHEALGTR